MDIRTKLILALVSVSLASMAILGLFAYKTSASLLQEISVRQLDALAESKKTNLLKVYESWKTQVRLIGSRTQLRKDFRDYQIRPKTELLTRLHHTLEDAVSVADDVVRVTLVDRSGDRIVSVGDVPAPTAQYPAATNNEVVYTGSFSSGMGDTLVSLHYPLSLDDEIIGMLEVVIDANDLATVTENYTGLGKTGEVLVVMDQDPDSVVLLNSVRHATDDRIHLIDRSHLAADLSAALAGEQKIITSGLKDYRGVYVWSATRYLPGLGWGLIVKVDAQEERERVDSLRENIIDLALALSAFAVVGGTLLGIHLAKPIQGLASVVHKLRDGDLKARAQVKGDDEVAYLSYSLNQLMDELQEGNKDTNA